VTVPAGEIRFLYNGDEVKLGTEATKAALADLAAQAELAGQDISSSLTDVNTTATTELGTTLPSTVDASAVSLTDKASKFKAVGTELGQALSGAVSSGAGGPEAVANVGTSMVGLLAATAKTAKGVGALVGIGIGVALIKNMIDGVKAERAAFVAEVDSTFNAVEVNAKQSLRRMRKDLIDTFTVKESIDQLKDLGIGVSEIEELTRELGVPFTEIVEILRGDINPGNRDTLEILKRQGQELNDLRGTHGGIADTLDDQEELAAKLVGLSDKRVKSNQEAYGWLKLEREAMGAVAADAERAAAAIERWAPGISEANRQGNQDYAV